MSVYFRRTGNLKKSKDHQFYLKFGENLKNSISKNDWPNSSRKDKTFIVKTSFIVIAHVTTIYRYDMSLCYDY